MDAHRPEDDNDITLPNIFGGPVDPPRQPDYPPPPPPSHPVPVEPTWTTASDDDTSRHALLPGWAAAEAAPATVLAPRPERRRAALFGVLGVVVATVAVVLVAIFVAPN